MRIVLFTDIFSNAMQMMVDKFVSGIPNVVMALILTVIGLIISKTISKAITKFLEKTPIDKLGEKLNDIDIVYKSGLKIKISAIFGKFIYLFLLLFFFLAATEALNMPAISKLVADTISFIPNLIVALILLVVGLLGADYLRKTIQSTCESLGIPSAKVISIFVFYFVFITVFIMALGQAKINTAFLEQNISIIIGGAVFAFSLGYGLASKDIVSNFLASIYAKDKIKIGEFVTINGITGQVVDINKFSFTLETEHSKVILPISQLSLNNIEIHN